MFDHTTVSAVDTVYLNLSYSFFFAHIDFGIWILSHLDLYQAQWILYMSHMGVVGGGEESVQRLKFNAAMFTGHMWIAQ